MHLNEWHETGDRFTWRGQEVFYQEAGEGEALFLLHGFVTSSWLYKFIWPVLSQNFRVIAPDYIGCGFSSKPIDYPYGIDERINLIYALADLLSIQECHLMAHSFSVNVAQELLYRQLSDTSRISLLSVCMLNGGIFSDISTPSFRQRLLLRPFFGKLYAKVLSYRTFKGGFGKRVGPYSNFPEDLMIDLFHQVEYNEGLRLVQKMNQYLKERTERKQELEEGLLKTNIPVQLIWGIEKEDQLAGIRLVHKYRELKGGQYVVMLKGIGHFPMVECPEVVLEYYLNFIKGIRSSTDNPLEA